MRPIRASELGSYLYCRRAWGYRQRGFTPKNQAELAAGTELHRRHGRGLLIAGFLRTLAWLLLLAALVALAAYFTSTLIQQF
ncbi:MAG: hypothetical protein CO094_09945 [Anaerolineae bacterium CG_4_9_14_3_um_filter_57_17]|nr:hypothetical protein [bacterium]NCT21837.1 hypothetical protein [bacterium]OIO83621.1 MAG: hypothetical protein AUK01_12115 [Anaerolineae bacterium CG2_30_57_67]PJB65471.1 MAG: hypothetical protein CO094_09945 [Anaerolineae bacterium CG_4_9_14_3_um_filter_57_17]